MMAWGFFLKLVIADRLAPMVNEVFNFPERAFGMTVLVGTIFFAFQIFCDFAGYSSIAIGAAKVMGYDLMQNFRRPYFSTSIREFWQRWHISLSTWFRDYVYIPLGGNRVVKWRWYYNLFITFFVSGIWHGANWTFIVWGALHGFYLVFAIMTEDSRKSLRDKLGISKIPALDHTLQLIVTLCLAWFAWIFFRANSITDAFTLISHLFTPAPASIQLIKGVANYEIAVGFAFIILLTSIHWLEEYKNFRPMYSQLTWVRWIAYVTIIILTLGFGVYTSNDFIYFQF
jgi:D-alanyl-lipoteichoic acid acyltransferase DltB (MBOAT superfamily)